MVSPSKPSLAKANAVTPEMLPTLLTNYSLKDIYNADEFELFFRCLPDKSYQLISEKCSRGKHSKIRITGLAAGNRRKTTDVCHR